MRVACDAEGVRRAAGAVRAGGVIVFPTDTVYGVGCDPFNAAAVAGVYRLKGRPASRPAPVLGGSAEELAGIAGLGPAHMRLAGRFWPGPLTIVAPLRDARLRASMGLSDTVAVRAPGGRCAQALLAECGLLVGTSANASGGAPHADPGACFAEMGGADVFVDGGRAPGSESTIAELAGGRARVLREGAVPREEVERDWG